MFNWSFNCLFNLLNGFYLIKPGKAALITIVTNLKLKMKFNRVYKLSLKGLNLNPAEHLALATGFNDLPLAEPCLKVEGPGIWTLVCESQKDVFYILLALICTF